MLQLTPHAGRSSFWREAVKLSAKPFHARSKLHTLVLGDVLGVFWVGHETTYGRVTARDLAACFRSPTRRSVSASLVYVKRVSSSVRRKSIRFCSNFSANCSGSICRSATQQSKGFRPESSQGCYNSRIAASWRARAYRSWNRRMDAWMYIRISVHCSLENPDLINRSSAAFMSFVACCRCRSYSIASR